ARNGHRGRTSRPSPPRRPQSGSATASTAVSALIVPRSLVALRCHTSHSRVRWKNSCQQSGAGSATKITNAVIPSERPVFGRGSRDLLFAVPELVARDDTLHWLTPPAPPSPAPAAPAFGARDPCLYLVHARSTRWPWPSRCRHALRRPPRTLHPCYGRSCDSPAAAACC